MNAESIKTFRPISCYIVFYKIIAKILANRMQVVIGDIIDPAHSNFIPKRQFMDTVLLALELVK